MHTGLLPADERAAARGEGKLTTKARLIDHTREGGPAGLFSVVGIKFTMARRVAEDITDRVFRYLGKRPPACRTAVEAIRGGGIENWEDFLAGAVRQERGRVPEETVLHLARNYGDRFPDVLASAPDEKNPAERFSPASPYRARRPTHIPPSNQLPMCRLPRYPP